MTTMFFQYLNLFNRNNLLEETNEEEIDEQDEVEGDDEDEDEDEDENEIEQVDRVEFFVPERSFDIRACMIGLVTPPPMQNPIAAVAAVQNNFVFALPQGGWRNEQNAPMLICASVD